MQIANPLYDVAFRYLMEDLESARILLSALLGKTVVTLQLTPTEYAIALEKQNLTVYRMDFAATVRRQQRHISLGDSIIAATALVHDLTLPPYGRLRTEFQSKSLRSGRGQWRIRRRAVQGPSAYLAYPFSRFIPDRCRRIG